MCWDFFCEIVICRQGDDINNNSNCSNNSKTKSQPPSLSLSLSLSHAEMTLQMAADLKHGLIEPYVDVS